MKIFYRILSVNEEEYSLVVRYWNDIFSENELSSMYDSYGKPILDLNGSPVRCKTDYNLSFSSFSNPVEEQITNIIISNYPKKWFELFENKKNGVVSLENITSLVGITESFDSSEIPEYRPIIFKSNTTNTTNTTNTANI